MSAQRIDSVEAELDTMAWDFLDSQYAGDRFTGWPIDRRLDAYLHRRGLAHVADDGTAFVSLLEQVMTNIALARNRISQHHPAGFGTVPDVGYRRS